MTPMNQNQSLAGLQQALFQLSAFFQPMALSPEQIAAQERQRRESELRASQVQSWADDQMKRMMDQQAQIQASFQTSTRGLMGMESSFGGFLSQSFQPFNLNLGQFGSGLSNFNFGTPNFFAGPIEVPNFFAQRSGFRRFQ